MKTIWYLAIKDLTILFRDRLGIFWFFGFPLLIALFFGSIFSTSRGNAAQIKLAVIDEDLSTESKKFIEELRQSAVLKLNDLALSDAKEKTRRGEVIAYLRITKGFGQRVGWFGSEPALVELGIDPSRRAEEGILQGVLMEASAKLIEDRFSFPNLIQKQLEATQEAVISSKELTPEQKLQLQQMFENLNKAMPPPAPEQANPLPFRPLSIETQAIVNDKILPPSSYDITFPQAVIWGLLSVVTSFAIGLVVERRKGTLLRLCLAPIHLSQLLASKGLACLMMTLLIAIVILLFGIVVFGIRVADPLQWTLAVVSTALCFTGIMMLLSTLGHNEQSVSTIGWSVLMPLSMIGGGMIPLFFMPKWMLQISHISPIKWSITAIEGAMWRGMTWEELLIPCSILIGIGLITFTLGVIVLKRKLR